MTDSHNGLRFLVVEDNPGDQYLITELLAASVIKIHLLTIAETLGKAIDHLQNEIFDIILLDLSLPDSSDIDTFKTIKDHTGKTPVIILSGLADMGIAVEAITLGAQDYQIKEELDEKILTKTILYSIERNRILENLRKDNEQYIAMSKAEPGLKQNGEITRHIISSALEAIICIDIYGKITVWSPQAEKIFGWNQSEIFGKPLAETIIPPEYRERHEKEMKHYLATGEGPILNKMIEITAMDRADQHFPVEMSIVPMTEGGNKFFCALIRDIAERKKAERELEESYKAIRKLTEHLQNIREEEKAQMAREIHDELGQQLAVLKMDISWINKKIGIQDESVKTRMKNLLVMLDETVKSVRRISSELRPGLLDDLGLIAAIEWQLTEFKKRFEIKTHFKPDHTEIKLPESMKTALFRIFQESLVNVARHSKAKKVIVSLSRQNGLIVLSVVDNGVGFDKQNTIGKKALGILSMQERISMIGGTYEISGEPGKGTRVVVTIPLVDCIKN
jgi:two-component system sensor histidine kinase UhpB